MVVAPLHVVDHYPPTIATLLLVSRPVLCYFSSMATSRPRPTTRSDTMTTEDLILALRATDPDGQRQVVIMPVVDQGDQMFEIQSIDPWTMEFGGGIRPEYIVLSIDLENQRPTYDIVA